jgi:hypothetical protein
MGKPIYARSEIEIGWPNIRLTPGMPLHFRFSRSGLGPVDKGWAELLRSSANSGQGLVYAEEPGMPPSWNPRGFV